MPLKINKEALNCASFFFDQTFTLFSDILYLCISIRVFVELMEYKGQRATWSVLLPS